MRGDDAVTIERDALGRPVRIDEPGSPSNRLRWDRAGRLIERRRGDLALRCRYDPDGERTALGYPDGTETHYTYDAGGRLPRWTIRRLARSLCSVTGPGASSPPTATDAGALAVHAGALTGYEFGAGGSRSTRAWTRRGRPGRRRRARRQRIAYSVRRGRAADRPPASQRFDLRRARPPDPRRRWRLRLRRGRPAGLRGRRGRDHAATYDGAGRRVRGRRRTACGPSNGTRSGACAASASEPSPSTRSASWPSRRRRAVAVGRR